jgi:methylglutaconyl-CoA hydratase
MTTLDEPLDVSRAGQVATVTLNRPALRNAFDDDLIRRLDAAFAALDTDPEVRVVVIAGAGPVFCAGADLAWMRRMADYDEAANRADAEALAAMIHRLDRLSKPVVARVQGSAFAGALGLVAAADIAIAATDARFSVSEVKLGLIPSVISPYLVRAMGERRCRQVCLTAELFDAAAAADWGLIHRVAPADGLDAAVATQVAALLAAAPGAVTDAKRLLADVAGRPIDAELRAATALGIARRRASAEGREGVQAFLDKRPPAWLVPEGGR